MMTKFKVGDRVKCLASYGEQFTKGKTYVVSGVYGYRVDVESDDRGSTTNGWNADCFELAPAFKIGDRVKVLDDQSPAGTFKGVAVGTVTTITDDCAGYGWMLEGSGYYFYTPGQLEIVTAVGEKPKFKFGDIVNWTYTRDSWQGCKVLKVKEDKKTLLVLWDGSEGIFDFSQSELVQPTPTTLPHIVAAVTNGQPRPSPTPFVHTSLASAQTEAERLANKTPGTTFEVYALVSRSVATTRQVVEPAKTEAA